MMGHYRCRARSSLQEWLEDQPEMFGMIPRPVVPSALLEMEVTEMNEFGKRLWENSIKSGLATRKAYEHALEKDRKEEEAREVKKKRWSR